MRAITVRQPWAWALVHGGKDVENRVRNIAGAYRGPVAIHAGLAWSEAGADDWNVKRATRSVELGYRADDGETWAVDMVEPDEARFVTGAIIGVVNLWAVHQAQPHCCPNRGAQPFGSPWAMADHWHLCVNDAKPLSTPIPAKGRLGLWRVADDLAEQIAAATTAAPETTEEIAS